MGCTNAGHKSLLLFCNVGLMLVGLSILVIGVKMKETLTLLRLNEISMLMKTVKAVIAAGFIMAVTGGTGFCGACYEILWLICVHLGGLGLIVVMEFVLGVILLVVKYTVESDDCGSLCRITLKSIVLDHAVPSAGIMMSVIIMEAMMVYSALKLFFYFRDRPKDILGSGPAVAVQNVQMQNVGVGGYPELVHGPLQNAAQVQPNCAPNSRLEAPVYHQPAIQPNYVVPTNQLPYCELRVSNTSPPPYAEVGNTRVEGFSKMEEVVATSTPRHTA